MAGSFESVCWLRLFALSEGEERCKSIGEVYKMATSKDILNSFGKEANIVKAVALYLGAEVRENQEGQFTHQLALLPSERDPKGGVVSIKHSKKLKLEENTVYYVEAESSSTRPDNHFGVSIYWLRNPQKLQVVSTFKEVAVQNG